MATEVAGYWVVWVGDALIARFMPVEASRKRKNSKGWERSCLPLALLLSDNLFGRRDCSFAISTSLLLFCSFMQFGVYITFFALVYSN